MPKNTINTVPCMYFCVSSTSGWWFVWRFCYIKECSTVSNTFYVYQAINFRKIKNIFMVSARFCEIYVLLEVLMYTFIKFYIFETNLSIIKLNDILKKENYNCDCLDVSRQTSSSDIQLADWSLLRSLFQVFPYPFIWNIKDDNL